MLDPEASRQTAHVFLDAVSIHHQGDATDHDLRDAMTGLALERLAEVGSIQIRQDDETGAVTLDFRAAGTGIIAVIQILLQGWATCAGVDRDYLIAEARRIVDEDLVDDAD